MNTTDKLVFIGELAIYVRSMVIARGASVRCTARWIVAALWLRFPRGKILIKIKFHPCFCYEQVTRTDLVIRLVRTRGLVVKHANQAPTKRKRVRVFVVTVPPTDARGTSQFGGRTRTKYAAVDDPNNGPYVYVCVCVFVRCVENAAGWGCRVRREGGGEHGASVGNRHIGRPVGGGKEEEGGRADSAVGSLICSDWQWWQIRCLWRRECEQSCRQR